MKNVFVIDGAALQGSVSSFATTGEIPTTRTVELKLRDPEQFTLVKVGNQVKAVYTEALALAVETANQ